MHTNLVYPITKLFSKRYIYLYLHKKKFSRTLDSSKYSKSFKCTQILRIPLIKLSSKRYIYLYLHKKMFSRTLDSSKYSFKALNAHKSCVSLNKVILQAIQIPIFTQTHVLQDSGQLKIFLKF